MASDEINILINRYDQIRTLALSEIDTQILLVEPVLKIAGWDIYNPLVVKRASRSAYKQEFDIEMYASQENPPRVKIAIECKSLGSAEFNAHKLDSRNGVGQLSQKQRKDLSLYWANKSSDGIGQIRGYCVNFAHFSQDFSIPVLTNGFEWLIFSGDDFVSESNLSIRVSRSDIIACSKLTDSNFQECIIDKLRIQNT